MKRRSQPVTPEKRDQNKIVVAAPKRAARDNIVNRHTGAFADRKKVGNKKACRGRSSSRSQEDVSF